MIKKIFLFVILTLFIFNSVYAYQEAQPQAWKQGECKDFIQTSYQCSYVILDSITNPDKTINYTNTNMTKNGATFNYTYCANYGLGSGSFNTVCPDYNVSSPVSFEVTPSGSVQTTAEGLGSMIFIVLLISLMILFGYLGYRFLNSDTLWTLGIFFIVLSLLFLVYNVWLVYEFKLNYTGSTPDAIIPQIIFYIFMTVLTAGLMVAFFMLFTKWKVIKEKFKSAIKPEEDDKDDLI